MRPANDERPPETALFEEMHGSTEEEKNNERPPEIALLEKMDDSTEEKDNERPPETALFEEMDSPTSTGYAFIAPQDVIITPSTLANTVAKQMASSTCAMITDLEAINDDRSQQQEWQQYLVTLQNMEQHWQLPFYKQSSQEQYRQQLAKKLTAMQHHWQSKLHNLLSVIPQTQQQAWHQFETSAVEFANIKWQHMTYSFQQEWQHRIARVQSFLQQEKQQCQNQLQQIAEGFPIITDKTIQILTFQLKLSSLQQILQNSWQQAAEQCWQEIHSEVNTQSNNYLEALTQEINRQLLVKKEPVAMEVESTREIPTTDAQSKLTRPDTTARSPTPADHADETRILEFKTRNDEVDWELDPHTLEFDDEIDDETYAPRTPPQGASHLTEYLRFFPNPRQSSASHAQWIIIYGKRHPEDTDYCFIEHPTDDETLFQNHFQATKDQIVPYQVEPATTVNEAVVAIKKIIDLMHYIYRRRIGYPGADDLCSTDVISTTTGDPYPCLICPRDSLVSTHSTSTTIMLKTGELGLADNFISRILTNKYALNQDKLLRIDEYSQDLKKRRQPISAAQFLETIHQLSTLVTDIATSAEPSRPFMR